MKDHAKELIRRRGVEGISMDELVNELIPVGRASVPHDVKGKVVEYLRGVAVTVERSGSM
jgi:hypothetical protein